MRITQLIAVIAMTAVFGLSAFAAPPLRVATEGAYPPFNYIDENGDLVGFDVDITKALCTAMGQECTIETIPWQQLLENLASGKVDLIVASMARTPEREQIADFSDYYYRSRSMFVGLPNTSINLTPYSDEQLTIATQSHTVQEQYLREQYPQSKTLACTTIQEAFTALIQGKADAVLIDSLTVFDFLQTDAGKPYDIIGPALPPNNTSSEARIAVAKGNKQLLERINKALRTIRLNGEFSRINHMYFPFSIY
ncbi:Polar amino acid transport system substrate-binding protein [Pseudodesulfovibrio profundus]|uniref:Polar amino acid transport system substrate-binding protein n=1 Tax=Pseudodesulfovibrio profundus TaxID=57320 RepID=A0A2C8FFA4_9BACT|nr:transporter substrate-binding domain-containing protein [Pseudodesulfovibrio profundus]SOB60730.1 Polar amino acid transport system substrate-binding protein [Pseudodesulfovibrio profundus]